MENMINIKTDKVNKLILYTDLHSKENLHIFIIICQLILYVKQIKCMRISFD